MTGAEHYREAERLLSDASFTGTHGHPVNRDGDLLQPGQHAALIARAQVHADLAKAAAAVLPTIVRFMGDNAEVTRWAKATGAYDESAPEPPTDGVTDKRAAAGPLPSRAGAWTALVGQNVTVILANRLWFYGRLLHEGVDIVRVQVTSPNGSTGATEWPVEDIDSIALGYVDPAFPPVLVGDIRPGVTYTDRQWTSWRWEGETRAGTEVGPDGRPIPVPVLQHANGSVRADWVIKDWGPLRATPTTTPPSPESPLRGEQR